MILWNYFYRKIVVVEAIGLWEDSEPEYGDLKSTYVWLDKIQSLFDTIDFEHGETWAYMISRPSGRRIIQRPAQRYGSSCDFLWAPRIDLAEVEITSLWFYGHGWGRGVWRGKKVDIQLACDDVSLKLVERATRASRILEGMDLTYAIVAHIFVGDLLFGLLTEPSHLSRPVELTDRAIVYAAFAKLERAFMLHGFLIDGERMVINENGRVRLLDISSLQYYAPHQRKQLEEDAQKFHWDCLRKIFNDLAVLGPAMPYRFSKPASTILVKTPSPERLLLISFQSLFQIYIIQNEETDCRQHKPSKRARRNPKTLSLGPLPLGPKQGARAHGLVLAKPSRRIEAGDPPPHTTYSSHAFVYVPAAMIAPRPEVALSASIVEVE
ncbi:hypothetical protein B0H12DRAFT_774804 [Mycena haematopus]|nr:hypothetical protein B0H12DRAFT_774804 [Mycena haematopus]